MKLVYRWIPGGRAREGCSRRDLKVARAVIRMVFIVYLHIPGTTHAALCIYVYFLFCSYSESNLLVIRKIEQRYVKELDLGWGWSSGVRYNLACSWS